MRSSALLTLLAVVALAALCRAWDPADQEIFRLRDEVVQAEGPDVTFYDVLGVAPSASQQDISKALRKKSMKLHPDKAIPSMLAKLAAPKPAAAGSNVKRGDKPGVHVHKGPSKRQKAQVTKEANERYARFRTVAQVLQSETRDRYDHFLRNGFPVWKGTGYYYARFRPGLGTVLVGLFAVFGGAGHYVAMYVSWRRQQEFVTKYVTHARKQAWGSSVPGIDSIGGGAPVAVPAAEEEDPEGEGAAFAGPLNRRQKRMQEKESKKKDAGGGGRAAAAAAKSARANGISRPVEAEPITGPQGSRKKVVAQNGRVLIVDSAGDVYLEEITAEGQRNEYLLDPEAVPQPTFYDTAVCRLPVWLFNQTGGRVMDMVAGTSERQSEGFLSADGADLTLSSGGEAGLETATASNLVEEGEARKRKAKSRR